MYLEILILALCHCRLCRSLGSMPCKTYCVILQRILKVILKSHIVCLYVVTNW